MIVYKIKNKEGLYSTGGMEPSFNSKGKTWSARNHISSHLAQFTDIQKHKYYDNCAVVVIEIKEEQCDLIDVSNWELADKTKQTKERKKQKRLEYEKEWKQREIERLQKEITSLKNN